MNRHAEIMELVDCGSTLQCNLWGWGHSTMGQKLLRKLWSILSWRQSEGRELYTYWWGYVWYIKKTCDFWCFFCSPFFFASPSIMRKIVLQRNTLAPFSIPIVSMPFFTCSWEYALAFSHLQSSPQVRLTFGARGQLWSNATLRVGLRASARFPGLVMDCVAFHARAQAWRRKAVPLVFAGCSLFYLKQERIARVVESWSKECSMSVWSWTEMWYKNAA